MAPEYNCLPGYCGDLIIELFHMELLFSYIIFLCQDLDMLCSIGEEEC
jgi:hypothetical protein